MSKIHFHSFENGADLAKSLSLKIAEDLQEAIAQKGAATLIVSGGNTPKSLFENLRKLPLDWGKVTIGLCDERWVPQDHEASNARLVKTYLLQDHAKNAKFVGMFEEGKSVDVAEFSCSLRLKNSLFPFDVVVLGMGSDGHTASLFPNNPKLALGFELDSRALCIALEPENAPHRRMSLTRSAILSAAHLYLHFEGKEKRAVYETALEGEDLYAMPIRAILKQNIKEVEVYYA